MDPNARKRIVIGRSPSLTLSNFTYPSFGGKKKCCIDHAQVLLISINEHFYGAVQNVFPIKAQPNNFFQILFQQCNCIYNLQL